MHVEKLGWKTFNFSTSHVADIRNPSWVRDHKNGQPFQCKMNLLITTKDAWQKTFQNQNAVPI